jgi:hypothetical protein
MKRVRIIFCLIGMVLALSCKREPEPGLPSSVVKPEPKDTVVVRKYPMPKKDSTGLIGRPNCEDYPKNDTSIYGIWLGVGSERFDLETKLPYNLSLPPARAPFDTLLITPDTMVQYEYLKGENQQVFQRKRFTYIISRLENDTVYVVNPAVNIPFWIYNVKSVSLDSLILKGIPTYEGPNHDEVLTQMYYYYVRCR